jgi:2-iminoacetate synthase
MSFSKEFSGTEYSGLEALATSATTEEVLSSLRAKQVSLKDFARLISDAATPLLPQLGYRSQQLTQQRFGKVIRLFAPLYLSNECVNNCQYCGFSRDNPILRVTLSVDEVVTEGRQLKAQGFRNLLIVSGEHPKFVSNGYLEECIRALRDDFPSISLEIGPMETEDYQPLPAAGTEGLVVYQETYDREVYAAMHTAGPKRRFDWRLDTPERAYDAGFRRLGIGALFGLSDWRREAIRLAAHALYLQKKCWKAQITISLPRLRPCAGDFDPLTEFGDRALVQLICALRLLLPDVGLILSTREPAKLRDGLIPLGITMMSAGSHTEPGGYTGAGTQRVHHTEKGRIVELSPENESLANPAGRSTAATGQFEISDTRTPSEIAAVISDQGYEPVWKDWDQAIGSQ